MNAILYVNKPTNMTSFDLCLAVKKILKLKKVGHCGTLDPNATGVMILLLDNAVKLNQFIVKDDKTYICDVKLGLLTDTLDIDGKILLEKKEKTLIKNDLIYVLNSFKKSYMQSIPMTSAKKINGKKLYEYQRENIEIKTLYKQVEIKDIKLLDVYEDGFKFVATVTSGTFIRQLVQDILKQLNLVGVVSKLERISTSSVTLDMCNSLNDIKDNNFKTYTIEEYLDKFYKFVIYEDEKMILNGRKIYLDIDDELVVIKNKDNKAIAMYKKENNKVFSCLRGLL